MDSQDFSNSKITIFAVLVILLGFPLLSWYYLKQGLDYQKSTRAELMHYGELSNLQFTNLQGQAFNLDSLDQMMSVISFIGEDEAMNHKMFELQQKLQIQFGKNESLNFLIVPLKKEKASVEYLSNAAEKYSLTNPVQHHFLSAKENFLQHWIGKEIKIPKGKEIKTGDTPQWILDEDNSGSINNYHYFVLVDTTQTIRNYYNYNNFEEVQRMVEHIAIMLPKETEPDAIIKREAEK